MLQFLTCFPLSHMHIFLYLLYSDLFQSHLDIKENHYSQPKEVDYPYYLHLNNHLLYYQFLPI